MAKVQKPKLFVEYSLQLAIFEKNGYEISHRVFEVFGITLPLAAADALDLNVVAAGLLEDCISELEEEQEQPNDTTA